MPKTPNSSGILVAVGRDQHGLANAVAAYLLSCECTIDDTDMETLRGYFVILTRFCGTPKAVDKVKEHAGAWGDRFGIDIKIYEDIPEYEVQPDSLTYDLRVDALEKMGIVDEVTKVLLEYDVNVRELNGGIQDTPQTGGLRFVMNAVIQIPTSRVPDLERALDALELDYVLTLRR